MNLRRLAVQLAGMGFPLPPMVRAFLPHNPPAEHVPTVPASLILGPSAPVRVERRRRSRFPGLSGNAHQRRIARRRLSP